MVKKNGKTSSLLQAAYAVIFYQLIIIVGFVVVLFWIKGILSSFSALLGGLSYWLPTLLFVWRVFARPSARDPKKLVMTFFAGETTKLLLSAVLFLLAVKYLPVNFLFTLIGYITAIVAFGAVSIFFVYRHPGVSL